MLDSGVRDENQLNSISLAESEASANPGGVHPGGMHHLEIIQVDFRAGFMRLLEPSCSSLAAGA